MRDAIKVPAKRIRDLLPTLFTALELEPLDVSEIPLTLIKGLDGHTGSPHVDSPDGRFKMSLLYYLHKSPKAFRGGDLEFYETDPAATTGHSDEAATRVHFQDNLLLAFPSQTFHGIRDVTSESTDFADGRLVAVGFLGPQRGRDFSP